MQCLRVKVRPIWPSQGMGNGINAYLAKEGRIAQRPPHFTVEDRLKINNLLGVVIEANQEIIVTHQGEVCHTI